ncbi:putative regulatory protein [Trichinella spiralis]|uniref:putative regulatory protein n=1 Tax=Trichinella spiralis TaxID=6334 RepID=UPI0001EFCAF7|nr:putative regulatory protein [Trichinella spiralis]
MASPTQKQENSKVSLQMNAIIFGVIILRLFASNCRCIPYVVTHENQQCTSQSTLMYDAMSNTGFTAEIGSRDTPADSQQTFFIHEFVPLELALSTNSLV